MHRVTVSRGIAVLAAIGVIAAWIFGLVSSRQAGASFLRSIFPTLQSYNQQGDLYVVYGGDSVLLGYAATGEYPGYSGPVKMLVGLDPAGEIVGLKVIQQSETPSYFQRFQQADYLARYLGKSHDAAFELRKDVDTITGATLTAQAIARGVRSAARLVGVQQFGARYISETKPVQFGLLEGAVLALFGVAYLAHNRRFPGKTYLRWALLLAGLVILGFVYNSQITISQITSLLAGYWPPWQDHLSWYLLLGGVAAMALFLGKNLYCSWFCPFGAAQEGLAQIAGAHWRPPNRWSRRLIIARRFLVWLVIVLGLALRNPGVSSFEPFGVLFRLEGTSLGWLLLGLVFFTSLFIRRPWCGFLCPIPPAVESLTALRRGVRRIWRRRVA